MYARVKPKPLPSPFKHIIGRVQYRYWPKHLSGRDRSRDLPDLMNPTEESEKNN